MRALVILERIAKTNTNKEKRYPYRLHRLDEATGIKVKAVVKSWPSVQQLRAAFAKARTRFARLYFAASYGLVSAMSIVCPAAHTAYTYIPGSYSSSLLTSVVQYFLIPLAAA